MMNGKTTLYHTGFQTVAEPDVHFGRKNADFGQGFYLSGDREFSLRWARQRRGCDTVLNIYEFDPAGLKIKEFCRDEAWFDYISANRAGAADALAGYDVIVGPVANDTLYDTWGIITVGLLKRPQALRLLTGGPQYFQTVLKTEAAASRLRFLSAETLSGEVIGRYRESVRREEKAYQAFVAQELGGLTDLLD